MWEDEKCKQNDNFFKIKIDFIMVWVRCCLMKMNADHPRLKY